MLRQIKAGTTDVSVVIRIVDSGDGTPETGVAFDTAGIDLEYRREGAVAVNITEATLADLTAAHSDGGFLHIGHGYYRLDLPDAACAAGATGVLVLGTVTGMVVIGCYVELIAYNPYDSVRLGLTALPNAAAAAANGLLTAGGSANVLPTDAIAAASLADGAITAAKIATGAIDADALAADAITAAKIAANAITAAKIADDAITAAKIATDAITADGLEASALAEINDQVVDVIRTDTIAELAAVPAANASLSAKINWLFALARNKITQSATDQILRNDADSSNIASASVSDDGVTATRSEWA